MPGVVLAEILHELSLRVVFAEDVQGLAETEFSTKGEDALTLHIRECGGGQEQSGDVTDIDKIVCKGLS